MKVKSGFERQTRKAFAFWSDVYEKVGVRYVDITKPVNRNGNPVMLYCMEEGSMYVCGEKTTVMASELTEAVKRINKLCDKQFEGKEVRWVECKKHELIWKEAISTLAEDESVKCLTTETLFNKVNACLGAFTELHDALAHLDYALCADSWNPKILIGNDSFRVLSRTAAGGSEGVYSDIYLETKEGRIRLACYKTLDEPYIDGSTVYARMGQIAGVFSALAEYYIEENFELFNKGYDALFG